MKPFLSVHCKLILITFECPVMVLKPSILPVQSIIIRVRNIEEARNEVAYIVAQEVVGPGGQLLALCHLKGPGGQAQAGLMLGKQRAVGEENQGLLRFPINPLVVWKDDELRPCLNHHLVQVPVRVVY